MRPFPLFGVVHAVILTITIVTPLLLAAVARRSRWAARGIGPALAGILIVQKLVGLALAVADPALRAADCLPMHLCDWAAFAVIFALLWHGPLAFELAWFWGLAGTFQGILTPDLRTGWTDLRTWLFFVSHCGIVAGAIYLALGLRLRPRPGAILRVFAWSQVYLLACGLTNLLCATNYGYVCAKPLSASLLDRLGSWPWYLLSLEALALIFFLILQIPFWIKERGRIREDAAGRADRA